MDDAPTILLSLKCPSCSSYLPVSETSPSASNSFIQAPPSSTIFANYTNEGGFQEHLDILAPITEEAYIFNHPEALPARALHCMCSEGDIEGIVELVHDVGDRQPDLLPIICYQDPLSDMKSGLHLAIEHAQKDVLWLLLWLCSTLSTSSFPEAVRLTAESSKLDRFSVGTDCDIRCLETSQGLRAEHLAQQVQGTWSTFLQSGVLAP